MTNGTSRQIPRRGSRVPGTDGVSAWAAAAEGARVDCDLTRTCPTRLGLSPDPSAALAAAAAAPYQPDPQGLESARRAIAEALPPLCPERLVLTASTSEAYTWLLKLLLEPGERIAAPRPRYPLIDLLARVEAAHVHPYDLVYDGRWSVDLAGVEEALAAGARAVVVVHPSNPVGATVEGATREALVHLIARYEAALIVDEVFLDTTDAPSFAGEDRCDTFVLSGLSKLCALPQVKLGWIHLSGPRAEVHLERLLWIADAFLSVSGPVQRAAPALLRLRPEVRERIATRLRENRAVLHRLRGDEAAWDLVSEPAGWYAVLRLPAVDTGEGWALRVLHRGVLVHPGEFYGLPPAHVVASLLPAPEVFQEGVSRLCEVVAEEVVAPANHGPTAQSR